MATTPVTRWSRALLCAVALAAAPLACQGARAQPTTATAAQRSIEQFASEATRRGERALAAQLRAEHFSANPHRLTAELVAFARRNGVDDAALNAGAESLARHWRHGEIGAWFARELPPAAAALGIAEQGRDPVRAAVARIERERRSQDPLARLRAATERYRALAAEGGWKPVPVPASATPIAQLSPAQRSALRARLHATGDWREGALVPSLSHFAARVGLLFDGFYDAELAAALNVSVYARLRSLRASLARAEAAPEWLRLDGVRVNLPAMRATYYQGGERRWQSDVIIGRAGRETPLLSSAIDTVVVNPNWWVPPRLAREYLLPKLLAGPAYARHRGFDILDANGLPVAMDGGNWPRALQTAKTELRFRQRPGPHNALGQVKFLFPNRHLVYLHDTNQRELFQRRVRTFSSGCVRLARPLALARALFVHDGRPAADIEALRASGRTHKIALARAVPLRLVYLSAEVDADGTVHFYPDVYRRDGAVVAAR